MNLLMPAAEGLADCPKAEVHVQLAASRRAAMKQGTADDSPCAVLALAKGFPRAMWARATLASTHLFQCFANPGWPAVR